MKALVVLAAACTPHVAEPPSAHVPLPARSSMHGTITSAVTREPLSGVVLLINPIDSFPGGRRPIDFNGPDFAQPTTNETGQFAIPEVPPGRYEVLIYYADLTVRRVVDVLGATAIDQFIDDTNGGTGQVLECNGPRPETCR